MNINNMTKKQLENAKDKIEQRLSLLEADNVDWEKSQEIQDLLARYMDLVKMEKINFSVPVQLSGSISFYFDDLPSVYYNIEQSKSQQLLSSLVNYQDYDYDITDKALKTILPDIFKQYKELEKSSKLLDKDIRTCATRLGIDYYEIYEYFEGECR